MPGSCRGSRRRPRRVVFCRLVRSERWGAPWQQLRLVELGGPGGWTAVFIHFPQPIKCHILAGLVQASFVEQSILLPAAASAYRVCLTREAESLESELPSRAKVFRLFHRHFPVSVAPPPPSPSPAPHHQKPICCGRESMPRMGGRSSGNLQARPKRSFRPLPFFSNRFRWAVLLAGL